MCRVVVVARPKRSPDVFDALADPSRRVILGALDAQPCNVSTLVERVGTSQSAVSQHLAVLRAAGLVVAERDGRERLYALRSAGFEPVVRWLTEFTAWSVRLDALSQLIKEHHGSALRS